MIEKFVLVFKIEITSEIFISSFCFLFSDTDWKSNNEKLSKFSSTIRKVFSFSLNIPSYTSKTLLFFSCQK